MNTIEQTDEFENWLDSLADKLGQKAINRRIAQMRGGLMGDVEDVGDKVSEARVHIGPGYRVYFTRTGNTIYLLLCGSDKHSQKRDIRRAKALAAQL